MSYDYLIEKLEIIKNPQRAPLAEKAETHQADDFFVACYSKILSNLNIAKHRIKNKNL